MKSRMLILAALALIPIAVFAHEDTHQGTMQSTHNTAEGGYPGDAGHAEGVGMPGDPKRVSRGIQVVMTDDMKFTPAQISVKRGGETIRFVLQNAGRIKHEMTIGSMAELKQHAKLMRTYPRMEHADSNMVTLAPGESGELIWQFTKAGRVHFACLQQGHFEAGMRSIVSVK
jgi:uncharacterized cupredoxin-like copper-binding protein